MNFLQTFNKLYKLFTNFANYKLLKNFAKICDKILENSLMTSYEFLTKLLQTFSKILKPYAHS